MTLDSTNEVTGSLDTQDEDNDPYSVHLSGSFVPNATQRQTEQETIRQSVHQRQSRQPVAPPTVS